MTFDDTPAALRAKWEADKARRASSLEGVDDVLRSVPSCAPTPRSSSSSSTARRSRSTAMSKRCARLCDIVVPRYDEIDE